MTGSTPTDSPHFMRRGGIAAAPCVGFTGQAGTALLPAFD